ncbi:MULTISPECIES: hypothetical protein [unclassified Sphingobacterium]|uniref:hypothetical protein n=1 Tax=unclassified Sphingobacterium TaxID=2609468 RepID=UPI001045BF1E|nr:MULTISPECIES: hypothetical protein [unclassified Sphingobacterium]MCS3557620.1 putative transposase YdaD [Sphingobacterium sp. JUb21]
MDKAEKHCIEKGERQKAISIALEFKKMGVPVEQIAKGTTLSIEELRRILRSKIEKIKKPIFLKYKEPL